MGSPSMPLPAGGYEYKAADKELHLNLVWAKFERQNELTAKGTKKLAQDYKSTLVFSAGAVGPGSPEFNASSRR